jgi:biofilm PGA synthesis lipoprotein PgaB
MQLPLLALMATLAAAAGAPPPGGFVALSYHGIENGSGAGPVAGQADRHAVEVKKLVEQFDWLRANGWHPVSVDQILEARSGGRPLPAKAVLLTFDDGYADVYRSVYPLLRLYGYPAVIALVGSWMDVPAGGSVDYDDKKVPRGSFLSWDEVREMQRSGLVEVASHSYDLHRGVRSNPQGNTQPAAVTRAWRADGRHETAGELRDRDRADLERNSALIERETGKRPRVMVWPYGRYSGELQEIARAAGMPVMFTLRGGWNTPATPLDEVKRSIIVEDPSLLDFAALLERAFTRDPVRSVRVDLDYVYDPDPAVAERNLSRLIDRIARMRPSDVYLQAFADPRGDGVAREVYFPNRHLPMRADLLNRVAWQLQTRAGVRVLAWLPVLAFGLPAGNPAAGKVVQASGGPAGTFRLSPFAPEVRRVVGEIYEDLAGAALFEGIAFHDDAVLGDREDASQDALRVYSGDWGLPGSVEAIRADPALFQRWSREKTSYLVRFTDELKGRAERFRKPLRTVRSLFARPVLDPAAEAWTAQSLPAFLAAYDETAVMAMPILEEERDAGDFLARLLRAVAAQPAGLARTVFELQARDWRSGAAVPTATLAAWMRLLELGGARNLGYYPDDFLTDRPALDGLMPPFSLRSQPE